MSPSENRLQQTRRHFFGRSSLGIGTLALANLLNKEGLAAPTSGVLSRPHHSPRAKRVIYLFMSGAPSQMDLFDHKPDLNKAVR